MTTRTRAIYTDDFGYDEVEEPWQVPNVTPSQVEECLTVIVEIEAYLNPAEPQKVVARIAALLSHYYVPDSRPELQRAVAHDWIDCIGEFPWWAIQEACRKWMRMERRRPTPSDIRDLCQRQVRAEMQQRDRLRKIISENDHPDSNVFPIPRLRRMGE